MAQSPGVKETACGVGLPWVLVWAVPLTPCDLWQVNSLGPIFLICKVETTSMSQVM